MSIINPTMKAIAQGIKDGDTTSVGIAQNVDVKLGTGDSEINIEGKNVSITTGTGNQKVKVLGGSDISVKLDQNADADYDFNNDYDQVLVLGDNTEIDTGNGNDDVVFYGNHVKINVGDGNNSVKTLDYAIKFQDDDSPFDYSSFSDRLEEHTYVDKYSDAPVTVKKGEDRFESTNISTTTSSTHTSGNTTTTRTTTTAGTKTVIQKYENNTIVDHEDTHLVGLEDVQITYGNGKNDMKLNVTKDLTINNQKIDTNTEGRYVKNTPDNKIYISGEIVDRQKSERLERVFDDFSTRTDWDWQNSKVKTTITVQANNDPLIVDFDRDGKISATTGKGVDLDNDGIADGIASRGDKMLALSDMNGNGQIDGTEVFGEKTISPFTGEKLNAKNGFEALRILAEQAERFTGIKCLQGNDVILALLQEALRQKGFDLGFVSENNVSNLESLGHVASINVSNYRNVNDSTDGIQYMQRGTYKDVNGKTYQAGDFWFTK